MSSSTITITPEQRAALQKHVDDGHYESIEHAFHVAMSLLMERDSYGKRTKEACRKVKQTVLEFAPDAKIFLYPSPPAEDSVTHSEWDFLVLLAGRKNEPLVKEMKAALFEIYLNEFAISCVFQWGEDLESEASKSASSFQELVRDCVAV